MRKFRTSILAMLLVIALTITALPATISSGSVKAEPANTGYGYLTVGDKTLYAPVYRNVTVYRDGMGVPHIYAHESHDAYYALGYIMAQDRIFEMDLFRRTVAGRLSEIFGSAQLAQDELMRTLGIYKIGQDTLSGALGTGVPADIKENLQQFSAGVNRYVSDWNLSNPLLPDVPLEYKALAAATGGAIPITNFIPYPWTPADSMAIAGLMGLQLTDTSEAELIRGAYMKYVEPMMPGITEFLMPTGWVNATTIMPEGCPSYKNINQIPAVTQPIQSLLGSFGFASNNWVISSNLSATGNALLANDPHLQLQTPGINWEVHIKTDDFNVIGCMIPGGPVIYTGHNDYFAFGVTNLMADVLDLYYYVFDNPLNPTQYWYIDHWEPLNVKYETIGVLGEPSVTIPVLSTRHGPLVSIPGVGTYAFRWSGAAKGFGEVEGLTRAMQAKNLNEWRQGISHVTVIIQNFVYADKAGNIAWNPAGAIPVRDPTGGPTHIPTFGTVPSNGSAGQNEWIGWIPPSTSPAPLPPPWNALYPYPISMPFSIDPEQGFIATANNQPIGPGYPGYPWPVWIGPAYGFDPGYRAQRITELITSKPTLTVGDMQAIQSDVLSIPARILTPYILNAYPVRPDPDPWIENALTYLQSYDYKTLRTSIATLIFEVWLEQYGNNTFYPAFGSYGLYPFPNAIIPLQNMTKDPTSLFAMILFNGNRDNVIRESLNDAISYLRNRLGSTSPDNMTTWQYGALHVVQFAHPLGSVLGYLNNPPNPPFGPGPVPADGDAFTVAPGSHFHTLIASQTYLLVSSGSSYRGIYEAKDGWGTSLIVVPPGESGLVTGNITAPIFSPHYRDTFGLWWNYLYTPCLFNDAVIQTYYESKTIFFRLTGDVNLDKKVNLVDIAIIIIDFGSHTGDPRYNPFADINRDGVINLIDLIAALKNFGAHA